MKKGFLNNPHRPAGGGPVGSPPWIDPQFHHRREEIRLGKRPAREEGASSDLSPAKELSAATDKVAENGHNFKGEGKNESMSNKFSRVCTETGNRKDGITKLKEWFQEKMRENREREIGKEKHSSLQEKRKKTLGSDLPQTTDPIEDKTGEACSVTLPARNRKLTTKYPKRVRKVVQPQDDLQQKVGDHRGILGAHPPLIHPQAGMQFLGDRKKKRSVKTGQPMKPSCFSGNVSAEKAQVTSKKDVENLDLEQSVCSGNRSDLVRTASISHQSRLSAATSVKLQQQDLEKDMAICTTMGNIGPATSYDVEKQRSVGRAQCKEKRSPIVQISNSSTRKLFDPGDKYSAHPCKPGETMVDQVMSESGRTSYSRNALLALRFESHLSDELRVVCKQVQDELGFSKGRQWPSSIPGHSPHLVAYVNQRTKQVGFIERHPSLSINHHESRDGSGSGQTTYKILCSNKRKINCVLSSRTISDDHKIPPSEEVHHMVVQAEVLQDQSPLNDVQDVSTDSQKRGTCILTKRSRSWLHPKQLGRSVRRCSGLTQNRNSIMDGSSKQHPSGARPVILSRKRKLISEDNFVVVKVSKLEAPVRPSPHRFTSLDLEFQFGVPEIVPQQSPQPP